MAEDKVRGFPLEGGLSPFSISVPHRHVKGCLREKYAMHKVVCLSVTSIYSVPFAFLW
jgi:hypothetical protein